MNTTLNVAGYNLYVTWHVWIYAFTTEYIPTNENYVVTALMMFTGNFVTKNNFSDSLDS